MKRTAAIDSSQWDSALEAYRKHLSAKGRSWATWEAYRYSLLRFVTWCHEHDIEPGQVTVEVLEDFALALRASRNQRTGGPLSQQTIQSVSKSVKWWVSFMRKRGIITDSTAIVEIPTVNRDIKPALPREDIDRIEQAARRERDKLLVRILADCGLRLGELCRLRVTDLQREGSRPCLNIVAGKTHKGRLVPISDRLERRLRGFIAHRDRADTDALFLADDLRPLTDSGAAQVIRRLSHEAGIEASPQRLRISFASHLLASGLDAGAVAKVTGHSVSTLLRAYDGRSATASWDRVTDALA